MSDGTHSRTAAALVPAPASTSTNGHGLLQRSCACGGAKSPLGDECDACKSRALQRKLVVGASDDPFELEADRVADRVLRRARNTPAGGDPVPIRRIPMQPHAAAGAPPSVERTLAGAGTPLDPGLRADMEARFAYDFSQVRLHAGSSAADSARDVSAEAYTVGHDIVFGAGRLAPGSDAGRRLIAHELAHVVQQSAANPLAARGGARPGVASAADGQRAIQPRLNVAAEDDPHEREADRAASRVMRTPLPALPLASSAATDRQVAAHAEALGPGDLTAGGTPMPGTLRAFFERRFGRDLGEVRLHAGPQADARNEQLGAYAFTYGSHIWLGQGQQPAADFLLAHELAHVIQQRQPRALDHAAAPATGTSEPRVQRLGASVPFWVPLGARGLSSGEELHEDLLGQAQRLNSNLDIEANAPNADTQGCGVKHRGRIDLYLSTPLHVMPGMYFDGVPDKTDDAGVPGARDVLTTTAKNFPGASAGIAAGRFRPYAAGTRIEGIADAPTSVSLGELKPASKPMLESGRKQLDSYACGMRQAATLTNAWSQLNYRASPPRWNLLPPTRLPENAFTIPPGPETQLVVADIRESGSRGAKYHVKVRPAWVTGALNVRGRVRVDAYGKGSGLWMYYAQPENLATLLTGLRSREIGAEIEVANRVQAEVIDPLTRAPEQAATLRKRRIAATAAPAVVQRKPKYDQPPPKFTERFVLSTWRATQAKLRSQIARPGAVEKKQLAALELFEGAHDAEEARAQLSQTGPSALPAKKADVLDILGATDPGKSAKPRKHPHKLGDVLGWLKHWTSRPAEILGVFRAAFGGVFVKIAHLASGIGKSNLFVKIKEGIKKLFAGVSMGTGAIAALMKEGLAYALGKVSDLLLPSVFRMVAGAIKTGIGKALTELFGGDLVRLALDQIQKWKDLVEAIEKKVEDALGGVLRFVTDVVAVIKKGMAIVDAVKKAERAIKIGIRLAECSGVYTCVAAAVSLVVDIDDKIILALKDKILSACNVRSLLAGSVRRLLVDAPVRIANGILGLVHDIVPAGLGPLKTVFSVKVQPESLPELKEMEDTDCWGIDLGFSLFDEGFSHPKKDDRKDDKKDDKKDKKDDKQSATPPPSARPRDAGTPRATKQAPDQSAPGAPTAHVQRPWDPSALNITFSPEPASRPAGGTVRAPLFRESLREHTRQSSAAAEWVRFCVADDYVGSVSFWVDDPFRGRPTPFTAPTISIKWKVGTRHHEATDPNPKPRPRVDFGDGRFGSQPLETSLPSELRIPVTDKDVVELTFTLRDPDSNTTLTYEDKVTVKIVPCA
jgi:hypothetical protein